MSARTTSRLFAGTLAVSISLLAACGASDDLAEDAEATASSVLDDGAVSQDEADALISDAEDAVGDTTVEDLEAAVGDEDLATLFQVLDIAGFDDIANAEQFTFFAPNDGAFAAIDADLLVDLLSDPDALRDILQDHLIESIVMAEDIPADGTVTTTGGLELDFDLEGDEPTVNGIPIVRTDVLVGDRGVVHVIDGLLLEN